MRRFFNNKDYILAAAIGFAAILVYLPSIQNEFVNWDDALYIYDNPYIRSLDFNFFKWAFSSFHAAFWIPLTWISYAIDHAFWGLNPMGYHLTNVILHGLNTFLVVILIVNLLKSAADISASNSFLSERGILTAGIITGLLFGLHPIHVESVAWATERKDVLYAFFFLLSIISYMSYATHKKYTKYILSLGFFLLALLSKPMAVPFPFVLLILDWYPFRRFESAGKLKLVFIEKIPFFVLSLASAGIIITGHSSADSLVSLTCVPLSTRIFVAFKSLICYLGKMLWPVNLIPLYPYPKEVSPLSFEYLSPVLLVVGITLACIAVSRKQRLWLAVWAYYTVTLFPVLGIFQAGPQAMADRFTYLPSLGPFLTIAFGVAWFFERLSSLKKWNLILKIAAFSMSAVVISMSYATIKQIGVWKNSFILWSYVIEKEPQKVPLAYHNRGAAFDMTGQYDRAIEDYSMAITLESGYAEAYHNRGVVYGRTGQYDRAIEDFSSAIALNPNYVNVYNDRGVAYDRTDQYDRAIEDYSLAITLDPGYVQAYRNRGIVYSRLALYEEALKDFTKAIGLSPNSSELYFNRGNIYRILGRLEEAEKDFMEAERIKP